LGDLRVDKRVDKRKRWIRKRIKLQKKKRKR